MFLEPDREPLVRMEQLWCFLKQKLSNKSLTVVGDGKQKRDFIDVRDVVTALIKSMQLKTRKI